MSEKTAASAETAEGKKTSKAKAKAPKPTLPKPKIVRFTTLLPVELKPADLAARADALAKILGQIEDVEAAKAEAAKAHAEEIKALRGHARRFAMIVRSRSEELPVACERVIHYGKGIAYSIRLDTKAEIERRSLTTAERQLTLPLSEEQAKAKPEEKAAS